MDWRWAALAIAGSFLLAMTIVAGFAIYTWGWRDRADDKGLALAYANTSLRALCGGQACFVQHMDQVSPGLWKLQIGGAIKTCGLINVNDFKLSPSGGTSQGLSTIPCTALPLKTPNVLTVAAPIGLYHFLGTPEPPSTEPVGFESDLVSQIGQRLDVGSISWIDSNTNPAATVASADFLIGQQVISPLKKNAVDYTVPYFTDRLALLTRRGSPAADTRTKTQLRALRLAAVVGDGQTYVKRAVKPRTKARLFKSPDAAFAALRKRKVDGIVIDFTSGYQYVSAKGFGYSVQMGPPKRFAIVFGKNDPLFPDVNRVLSQMEKDGSVRSLIGKWFLGYSKLPLLKNA